MSTTRVGRTAASSKAAVPSASSTSSTRTRTTRAAAAKKDEGEELGRDLDRILKVAEPEPQVATRRTPAKSRTKVEPATAKVTKVTKAPAAPATKISAVASSSKAASRQPISSTSKVTTIPKIASSSKIESSKTVDAATSSRKTIPSTTRPATTTVSSQAGPSKPRDLGSSASVALPVGSRTVAAVSSSKAGPSKSTETHTTSRTKAVPTAAPARVSSKAPPIASSRKTVESTTKSTSHTHASSSSSIIRSAKPTATAVNPPPPKPRTRPPRPHIEPTLAWAQPDMDIRARARAAMSQLNQLSKYLGIAASAGYQYGSAFTVKAPDDAPEIGGQDLTEDKVEDWLEISEIAIRTLREADAQGAMGVGSIQVDKAATVIAGRMSLFGHPGKALEILVQSRKSILSRYTPDLSKSSTRPASSAIPDKSSQRPSEDIPQEWLDMATFPPAMQGSEISDVARQIIFTAMIWAWHALLSLEAGKDDPTLLYVLPTATVEGTSTHYLDIARALPLQISANPINLLYRALLGLPTSRSNHWLYLRGIAIRGLLSIITTEPPSRLTPQSVWITLKKTCTSYAGANRNTRPDQTHEQRALAIISQELRDTTLWAERCIKTRGDKRELWFVGKEWTGLMDFWITLARKIGDVDAMHMAISYMNPGASEPLDSGPEGVVSSSTARQLAKGKSKASDDAESDVYRLCGDLAKLTVLLETWQAKGDEVSAAAVESGLKTVSLDELSDACTSLDSSEDSQEALGKACRGIERVRRGCIRIVGDQGRKCEQATLLAAARKWLGSAINFAEDLLQSPMDLSNNLKNCADGVFESIMILAQDPNITAQSALAHFNRSRRLTVLVGVLVEPVYRAELLKCLSAGCYNLAARYWRENSWRDVVSLSKLSCEVAVEALDLLSEGEEIKSQGSWTPMRNNLSKRFDILASSNNKLAQRKEAVEAYFSSLAYASPTAINQVEKGAATSSIRSVFEPLTEVNIAINRMVHTVMFDGSSLSENLTVCLQSFSQHKASIKGAFIERVLESLSEGVYKPEIAEICLHMGDALLLIYQPDTMPIRRSRTLIRMMRVISQSGLFPERFAELAAQVDCLSKELAHSDDMGHMDAGLMRYRGEISATALLQRALHAYHDPNSSSRVLELGRKAMQELRQCLIPPTPLDAPEEVDVPRGKTAVRTANRAPRTPAKASARSVSDSRTNAATRTPSKSNTNKGVDSKVSEVGSLFEDAGQISRLLSSLAGLLGMLGHVLAKIETLKLLRAVLRNEPDYADDYISRSAQLATEYVKLGKQSRAQIVFSQAFKTLHDTKRPLSVHARAELYLRHAAFQASLGDLKSAERDYLEAERIEAEHTPPVIGVQKVKFVDRIEVLTRAALANKALASFYAAQGAAASAVACLSTVFRLYARVSEMACRIAALQAQPEVVAPPKDAELDPFIAPAGKGADEPSKDITQASPSQMGYFAGKHLDGLQWFAAENLLDSTLAFVSALANRGSVKEVEYYLKVSAEVAGVVRSPIMLSRIGAQSAELQARLNLFEASLTKLSEAEATAGAAEMSGPDGVEINRIKGDLYARQDMIAEAGEMFDNATQAVQGFDAVFNATEALVASPRKMRASLSALANGLGKSKGKDGGPGGEVVLPLSLARVLRQQAWLLREAGFEEDSEQVLDQIKTMTAGGSDAEDLYLDGKIGLHEAFSHFKTDLWMSSLTESTLAMPMGDPQQRTRDRLSTRMSIQHILQRSEMSFISALNLASGSGKVEDVRQSCLSLALLRTFQTSLGEGSLDVTASAADILASAPAITLQRELLEAIKHKFPVPGYNDANWPATPFASTSTTDRGLAPSTSGRVAPDSPTRQTSSAYPMVDGQDGNLDSQPLKAYWRSLEQKHSQNALLSSQNLSSLPPNWVVISINVTADRTTMFISRHQADHEPIVFCLPLDRQGKREGEAEDEVFNFNMAVKQLQDIIDESNETARNAKHVATKEGREIWWAKRFELDKRMKELVETMEFCWLGAFKTILSPKSVLPDRALEVFRSRLERIFTSAITGADLKKSPKVHLDDTLLRTFATLSSKCRDEEVEDLVYFILDIYQFYGVQVALAELDIDLIGVDVKSALCELEAMKPPSKLSGDEHMFLALDKNVSGFPWESIPILRGRAVSRVPSLPFLLDQVELLRHLPTPGQDGMPNTLANGASGGTISRQPTPTICPKRKINTRRVFYILNSSGDLTNTQAFFEPWLATLKDRGWKGIVGRAPTELEMIDALTNYDLVLYFGHGGAEQYIRSFKVRQLPHCATVMLWGCSSGALKDQGDFDRTGTAYNYIMGGCPSLVANLWDVTDRDIDRLSEDVLKRINLDAAHIPVLSSAQSSGMKTASGWPTAEGLKGLSAAMGGISLTEEMSSVQAVALAREECKLKYLTGAAPVVYGLPVYFH